MRTEILIQELWRQRQDLRSAGLRLQNQMFSLCRRLEDDDKEKAAKRLTRVLKNQDDPAFQTVMEPYLAALNTLDEAAIMIEKSLRREAARHPLWLTWGKDVRGIAELSLAGLIGEAGRPLVDYRGPAALWKRFGLAVIQGERQRRKTGDEGIEHAFSPKRRAYAHVIATNLIRSQRKGDPFRDLYDQRKSLELERGLIPAHANNRAMRYMVKAVLKSAWISARALERDQPA